MKSSEPLRKIKKNTYGILNIYLRFLNKLHNCKSWQYRSKTGIINFKSPKLKKVHRTGYICSFDNVIHTEGASHRNIFS